MSNCLFKGRPCSEVSIESDKQGHCVCLACTAWLNANLPGFEILQLKRELESTQLHLDACYRAVGVSHVSSRSVASYVADWRRKLEEIAASESEDGEVRKLLRLKPGQKTIAERGNIV